LEIDGGLNRSPQRGAECICGVLEAKGFPRSLIELTGNGCELSLRVMGDVFSFWEVLPKKPVGVLVAAALPGAVGIAKVDRDVSSDTEVLVEGPFPCRDPR
jgi:hypothetical protein